MDRLTIKLGPCRLRLEGADASVRRALDGYYRPFATDAPPDATLTVATDPRPMPEAPEPGPSWRGAMPFELLDGAIRGFCDVASRRTLAVAPSWLLEPGNRRAFEHIFIPMLYLHAGIGSPGARRTLLVHGSAVEVLPGRAALFMAPSEGGKSTIAGLLAPRPVLHEEALIVSWEPGRETLVEPSPIGGLRTQDPPHPVRLESIFLLDKALGHHVRACRPIEAETRVLVQVALPDHFPGLPPRKELLRGAIEATSELLTRVPVRVLEFARRADVGNVLERQFAGGES